MTLKRRTRIDQPGAPEVLGLVLLCAIAAGSIISFMSYMHPPIPMMKAKTPAAGPVIPLTEEGLRRVLQNSQLAFGYSEESGPAEFLDSATADGMWTGGNGVPPIVFSQGDGMFTVDLGGMPVRAVAAEAWPLSSPFAFRAENTFGSWFAVTLLAYIATLIYFTTIYPMWRRGGVSPFSSVRNGSVPPTGQLF